MIANQQFHYQLSATDPEGDPLSYELWNEPQGMTLNQGLEVTWTPGVNSYGTA